MKNQPAPKAIFFDRDNTLIYDKGYMYKFEDLKFFPDTIEVLKSLQEKDYMLFVVTNQSGIGRGYFQEKDMHAFNQNMITHLANAGIEIADVVFCPHAPEDNCDCRKPSPKLINQLCDKYNIDKGQSYMVGDKDSDVQAGENAGVKSIKFQGEELKTILDKIS